MVNPYVGPKWFEETDKDRFFGREREARDLLAQVVSERLVLFYAQSGAGKSSLLRARLIPNLREQGFEVLPIGRVSGELPTSVAPNQVSNIFIFNLLLSLNAEEEAEVLPAAQLVATTLTAFLAGESKNADAQVTTPTNADAATDYLPTVLIIDQFEELLTTNLHRWQERVGFFSQLRDALERFPNLWVVLTLREDYLAGLDPYAYLLSNRLSTRYYMQRLGVEAALEAVQRPAAEIGNRPFAAGVAEALVDNLRRIKVIGQERDPLGQSVEPVQLQVVCYQLWENLEGGSKAEDSRTEGAPQPEISTLQSPITSTYITESDLKVLAKGGDLAKFVDEALSDYYALALSKVLAANAQMSERQLRDWFSTELITKAGTRGFVLEEGELVAGLPRQVVWLLQDQFLVRAETRAGGVWYELTHDRFVEPILEANRAWAARNQNPLTQAAQAWRNDGEPARQLYRDRQLAEAAALLERMPDAFGELERAFVNAGQAAEKHRKEQRLRWLTGVGTLAILVLTGLTAWALRNAQQARDLSHLINADLLVAKSLRLVDEAPQRALLLAAEGNRALYGQRSGNEALLISAETDFRDLLQQVGGTPLRAYEGAYNPRVFLHEQTIAFSPDGKWLAGANDEKVWLWEMANPTAPHVLRQHSKRVAALAFSPDGRWLASAGAADNSVRLWSMDQLGSAPRILAGEKYTVTAMAFSPDGHWLAGASAEGTVRLWGMGNPEQASQVLAGTGKRLTSVVFSPHGRWLASGVADGTVLLWPMANPTAKSYPLHSHKGPILATVFSPDERWLATISGEPDTAIRLWELANLHIEPRMLDKHTAPVWAVAFSPNGRWLASGSRDKTVRLWDLTYPAADPRVLLPGHTDYVTAVAFSPNGRWLASASWDQTVRLWDMNNLAAEPRVLHGHEFQIVALLFSPDGRWLASASKDQIVRLWQTANPLAEPRVLTEQQSPVRSVAFSPDQRWLASAGVDGAVQLWDRLDPTATHKLIGHQGAVNAVAFSPDGRWLASASDDRKVDLWSMTSNPVTVSHVLSGHVGPVLALAFSADGRWLASGSADKTVRLWEMANPVTSRHVLTENMAVVFAVAFSPDGRWLASGGRDRKVRLWQMANLSATQVLTGHQSSVTTIAFSPDSQQLASGSSDFAIRLWSMTSLTSTQVLTRHIALVFSVAFSADGRWLASSSYDRTVRLWDTANLTVEPRVLRGHTDGVYSVAFSPDSQQLASGGDDKTVRLWTVPIDALIEKACQVAGRNLTPKEWTGNFPDQPYRKTCSQWPEEP